MKISIIVVSYNEAKNIKDCLDSLLDQDYGKKNFEIIVSDGDSKDGTVDIVKSVARKNQNVRLFIEKKRGTAAGRNAGIRAAQYDFIAFIDADCRAPQNWLSLLAKSYKESKQKNPKVIAAGGRNIPDEQAGIFVNAISIALDTYFGSFGSVQGRQFQNRIYVESIANLNALYEKDKIIEIGLYDESLYSEAEDAELNFRLQKKGFVFVFIPESFVWHKMRPTIKAWFKNMFRYGKGRARLLKRYPEMWKLNYVLPLLFIFQFGFLLLIPVSKFFIFPLVYFPILLLISLFQALRKKLPLLSLHIFGVFLSQHFGYAMGEFYGLINRKIK